MNGNAVSLSIIVPAYNEQENLRPACETILRLAPKYFSEYEVLIVDDNSKDATWDVAQALAKENPRIRIFRNAENRGLGFNYHFGVEQARCKYVMLVPGDNEASGESLDAIFSQAGAADILVTHIANRQDRPIARQITSRTFTHMMNTMFGLKLQYYNGINVIRTDLARKCPPRTGGFAYMALILVQLLKVGNTYATTGFKVQKRAYGVTKAFQIKNVISVLKSVGQLWKEMYLGGSSASKFPQKEQDRISGTKA